VHELYAHWVKLWIAEDISCMCPAALCIMCGGPSGSSLVSPVIYILLAHVLSSLLNQLESTPVNNAPFVREFPARSRPCSLARVSCSCPLALIPTQRLPAPLQRGRCLVIETTLISLHHFSVMFLMMPLSLALSIEN